MSRSYKKTPMVKDPANPGMKRQANKRIRHIPITEDIPNGRAYKKYFCSWDISDYRWRWTKEDALKEWESSDCFSPTLYDTLDDWLQYWEKCVKRK